MHLLLVIFVVLVKLPISRSSPSRTFNANNSAACLMHDKSRGNITMSEYDPEKKQCTCLNYPINTSFPSVVYFPYDQKNSSKSCQNSWEKDPLLYAIFWSLPAIVYLYAATHAFYVAVVSGMCSCKRHRCTKHNNSALFLGIMALCFFSQVVLTIAGQQVGVAPKTNILSGSYYLQLAYALSVLNMCVILAGGVSVALLATSISDMVNHGKDMAGRRRCTNIVFWTVIIAYLLSMLSLISGVSVIWAWDLSVARILMFILMVFPTVTFPAVLIASTVLIVIAHRKMRTIVRTQSTSTTTPSLLVKLNDLSIAICRYFYAWVALVVAFIIANMLAVSYISPTGYWFTQAFAYDILGTSLILHACILEGKPCPTFPACLCRRRRAQSGLHFTALLGDALALLTKYGLDTQRQKDFPVEAAKESLLSTSTLMVAAAPDMDLMACIDHFVDRCVDDQGKIAKRFVEMPLGSLLRNASCNQHVVTTSDIPLLRTKAKQCLEWARDPARQPIAGMTDDQAAAIQLYTQHCCLYPMLNAALRDHTHPENLAAFLPYLKLLLTALNKLSLVRAKVYRGMTGDYHGTYNQLSGQVLRWWAFSSTTPRESQAEAFLMTGERTLFTIDAIGVDIAAFSAFPGEKEVLLLPGTCLEVKPGVEVEPNYWKFEASVWEATQHQLHTHNQHPQPQQHHDGQNYGALGIAVGVSTPRFQDTDLPHPGWEGIT